MQAGVLVDGQENNELSGDPKALFDVLDKPQILDHKLMCKFDVPADSGFATSATATHNESMSTPGAGPSAPAAVKLEEPTRYSARARTIHRALQPPFKGRIQYKDLTEALSFTAGGAPTMTRAPASLGLASVTLSRSWRWNAGLLRSWRGNWRGEKSTLSSIVGLLF